MSWSAWLVTPVSACATSPLPSASPNGAAHRILSELVDEGYVVRERQGRRNRYQVKTKLPLPHPLAEELEVGELLEVLIGSTTSEVAGTPAVGEGD